MTPKVLICPALSMTWTILRVCKVIPFVWTVYAYVR
jgi:hypothetical protein